ncbi:MAG: outer membrane lipoprotein-sorting protein [Spirochaetaceae bacterium]|nr:outer membrane lipoprotein-sorting protein [Spirochaetaceae bacterium]
MSKRSRIRAFLFLSFLAAFPAAYAQTADANPDFRKILTLIDERSTFPKIDFSAVVQMKTTDPEKGDSDEKSAFFRRDSLDAFLILQLEPSTKKGQGMLLVSDNLWKYDPVSRKFSHSSLKDNYGDSAAKNSDFRSSSKAKDYKVAAASSGALGKFDCWILELEAVRDDVTYPFMKLWVSKSDNLLLKAEEYSLTRRLLRTSLFPSYSKLADKYIATRSIFQDGLVAGKRTEIIITDLSVKALPDDMFTKSYLEKVGK